MKHLAVLMYWTAGVAAISAFNGRPKLESLLEAKTPLPKRAGKSYPDQCYMQKRSHFDPSLDGTFCQRWWYDATYYKEGGPVFILDGGETSGAYRWPYMEKGILQILANATGGLSVILEHRYYGESFPVPDLSTDNLRFLNNKEALEDSAEFIRNFKPPQGLNVSDPDIFNVKTTPFIYYGGSYAGARAAFMRTQYPDLVWGAIGSGGVTHASVDYSAYFDPIMKYGDQRCIRALEQSVHDVDYILRCGGNGAKSLKTLFGLQELEDDDFGSAISSVNGYWQSKNWDPAVGTTDWDDFCKALTNGTKSNNQLSGTMINWANWIKTNVVTRCGSSIVDCFGSHNDSQFQATGLSHTWRSWQFQVCTEWGFFQYAPRWGRSIVPRVVDLKYTSKICKLAFPPGQYFTVPQYPDVRSTNAYGGFNIRYDRLAFIDGDRDPWRPATPGSDFAPRWQHQSTQQQPRYQIFDAVHHYDENGLVPMSDEPARIQNVHNFAVDFVKSWVAEFKT